MHLLMDLLVRWRLVWLPALLLVLVYVAFVCTPTGQAWDDQALIGNAELTNHTVHELNKLLHHINLRTSVVFALVIAVVGIATRRVFVGIITAVGFGVAVFAAELLKRLLDRPEYDAFFEADLIDKTIDTFPSGHVTIMTSFVLALMLVAPSRARAWVGAVGSIAIAVVGIGVVVAGWHRPSDSLGGALLGASVMGAVALVLNNTGRPIDVTASSRAALLVSVIGTAAVLIGTLLARQPDATLPAEVSLYALPTMLLLVAVISWATPQWFARELRTAVNRP